ncbi:MAG: gliding motility protein, partial [Bacteroidota bacterium]|nr:gliding motility protein [Bacteroidota bacterium]
MRVFTTLAFLVYSVYLQAQLSKTHYIPPITAAQDDNAQPQNQYLHISTPTEDEVNVAVNQVGAGTQEYTVSNANPLEIFIGNGYNTPFILPSTNTASASSSKGYIIQSDKAVYVSVRLSGGANQSQAGSLVSKGLSGLGKTFRVGTFTNLKPFTSNNLDYLNFVSVMATENNTQIDFSDFAAGVIIENNTPLSTILNAGESYVIALNPALTTANRDGLIGVLVTSNKDIVVNCGSFNGSNY